MTSQNSFTEETRKPLNSFDKFDQGHLGHPIPLALPAFAPSSFPCHPALGPGSIPRDGHFGGSLTEEKENNGTGKQSTNGADVSTVHLFLTAFTNF
jgi:hypothetical protein